jgi:sugar lactone lactonase YvrE
VNQFLHPGGIAIDRFDRIYVADRGNSRIACFNNMSGGGWITYDGRAYGRVGAQVLYPVQIAVDGRGRIYYLRPEGGKVVRVDDMFGRGMIQYGNPSSRDTILNNPGGLAIDAYNRVYISDTEGRRVVRLDDMNGAGRVELDWGSPPNVMRKPTLVCVGKQLAVPAPRIR